MNQTTVVEVWGTMGMALNQMIEGHQGKLQVSILGRKQGAMAQQAIAIKR
jgi:hypothetical protein